MTTSDNGSTRIQAHPGLRSTRAGQTILRSVPLLVILILAMAVRIPMLRQLGYELDQETTQRWTLAALRVGILQGYKTWDDVQQPPIDLIFLTLGTRLAELRGIDSAKTLADNPEMVDALKW